MPRLSSHFGIQDPRLMGPVLPLIVVSTLSTDSNQTYTTDQILGGLINRSIGAARTDTLPTAAALVDAIQGCMVGTAFRFNIRNTSAGAYAETLAAGAGGTTAGTMTTAQNFIHEYMIVFTNVTIGSEAYTVYSMDAAAAF